jgi:indole-3-glycerol phosphate synthase
VRVPVLKKDFTSTRYSSSKPRRSVRRPRCSLRGRSAPDTLLEMLDVARRLSLEVIVEIRDEAELARAIEGGAAIIGINNRNLETLVIDPATSDRLLLLVPPGVIAIAESGVAAREDVERVARHGADAVLVGSVLSAAPDAAAAVERLTGVPRVGRDG